jgi:hypothetical protein
MKKILAVIVMNFTLVSNIQADESVRGKLIEFNYEAKDETAFEVEYPRIGEMVFGIKEVIDLGDKVLINEFGKDFETKVFGVSLQKKMKGNGFIWCWHIMYHYKTEPSKDFDDRLSLYFSTTGKSLMIFKDKTDERRP